MMLSYDAEQGREHKSHVSHGIRRVTSQYTYNQTLYTHDHSVFHFQYSIQ